MSTPDLYVQGGGLVWHKVKGDGKPIANLPTYETLCGGSIVKICRTEEKAPETLCAGCQKRIGT